jgi:hypothetical protein
MQTPHITSPPVSLIARCESENHTLWVIADKVGQQIADMRDFARILAMAGESIESDEGVAIGTVAFELVEMAGRAAELTAELQHRLKSSENTETDAEAQTIS